MDLIWASPTRTEDELARRSMARMDGSRAWVTRAGERRVQAVNQSGPLGVGGGERRRGAKLMVTACTSYPNKQKQVLSAGSDWLRMPECL